MLDVTYIGIIYFDNNQILSRSWKVAYNSKPLISVVTTVVALQPPTKSSLQHQEHFLPGNWLKTESVKDYDELMTITAPSFRARRNSFLQDAIEKKHY